MHISSIVTLSLAVAMPILGQELAGGQSLERRDGAVVAADYDYSEAVVSACGVSQAGGETMLTATVAHMSLTGSPGAADVMRQGGAVQKGREKGMRVVAGPGGGPNVDYPRRGIAFTVAPSPGGGMPVVQAMASNEKGTGATANGRILLPAVQKGRDAAARHAINTKGTGATNGRACDAPAASVPAVASCSVSGDADAPDLTFTIPLSALGGDARQNKIGHVTLMKRGEATMIADGETLVATCTSDARMIATYDLKALKK